jgi:hypothetical protein
MSQHHSRNPFHRPRRREPRAHPQRRGGWFKTPAGLATAVAAPLIVGLIVFITVQVIDTPAAKDRVRSVARPDGDQDVRYTVRFNDQAYQIATPAGVGLTTQQRDLLRGWDLGSPGSLSELITDLRARGGANPDELRLLITLEGRRHQRIFVDDIRPVNIKYAAPYAGTLVNIPPQEGGETLKMMFNFDEFEPRARVFDNSKHPEGVPGNLYFNNNTLTIKEGEQDSIAIKSVVSRRAVTFDIRINYRVGGKSKELDINNRGKPFALTPMNCPKKTKLIEGGWIQGRMAYREIWEMKAGKAMQVAQPGNHPAESPFCVPSTY